MLEKILEPALRQYRHNMGGGFVVGYDQNEVLKIMTEVLQEKENLKREAVNYEYPNHVFYEIIRRSAYAFYLFQWVPYQTDARAWRLKMNHDVKTFDGREEHGIWPNGEHCGSFKDEEVEFIRISKKQHGDEYIDPRDKPKQDD